MRYELNLRKSLSRYCRSFLFAYLATILAIPVFAGTNGFIMPLSRGLAEATNGFWKGFSSASGEPGNPPDQPGATSHAVLRQSDTNAFLTGSGNIYNLSTSAFTVTDSVAQPLGTVAVQIRAAGSELDYNSISLLYTNSF